MVKSCTKQRPSGCVEEISTRQGTRKKSLQTSNFDTSVPEPIINKMKVPLLVLCLVVIYGTCRISADLIDDINNDRDITVSSLLGKSLSRQKRTLGIVKPLVMESLSPILKNNFKPLVMESLPPILKNNFKLILKLIESISKIGTFVNNLLKGEIIYPDTKNLNVQDINSCSIETIKKVLYYICNAIGSNGRAIVLKLFEKSWEFFRMKIVPLIHDCLNKIDSMVLLPPSIKSMITTFNAVYNILKLLGYVG